ncbi:MAG TPA: pyridoxal-dependent decarboxylase [Longimicrobiaceae bacterium]|nr:pyridoxal-dependent decarboxylase [Longimicrobiaceae bacterium]
MHGQWSPEQVRKMGEAVTAWAAGFFGGLEARPISPEVTPAAMDALFAGELPEEGAGWERAFAEVVEKVEAHSLLISHPRYFGLMNPTPLVPAIFTEVVVSALNQNMGAWSHSPAATAVEKRVVRWLCDLVGYGPEGFGVLCSGGSVANLMGVRAAVANRLPAAERGGLQALPGQPVFYVSSEAHFSFPKSATVLGLGTEGMRMVPVDGRSRLRVDALRAAIREDRAAGRIPFCVAAIAGTTSSGAVDPLEAAAEVAEEEGLWYHVDAAWGSGVLLSPRHRHLLRGIERADSITFDPHKWFFMPMGTGAILVRERRALQATFEQHAVYIPTAPDERVDFRTYGIAGSRRCDALKLWVSVQALGTGWFRETVDRHMELTRWLAERIAASPAWEAVEAPELNILCFRYLPAGVAAAELPGVQDRVAEAVARDGRAWVSPTTVRGVRAIRWMALSPALTRADLELFWEAINELAPGAARG